MFSQTGSRFLRAPKNIPSSSAVRAKQVLGPRGASLTFPPLKTRPLTSHCHRHPHPGLRALSLGPGAEDCGQPAFGLGSLLKGARRVPRRTESGSKTGPRRRGAHSRVRPRWTAPGLCRRRRTAARWVVLLRVIPPGRAPCLSACLPRAAAAVPPPVREETPAPPRAQPRRGHGAGRGGERDSPVPGHTLVSPAFPGNGKSDGARSLPEGQGLAEQRAPRGVWIFLKDAASDS